MAKLFFDQVMEFLGVPSGDENQPVQADDPLGTSDPQFGYRDYTPAERAQEVLYGSLDTAGSMARGVAKAAIEAPRDIYALGSAINKIQDRTQQRLAGKPVKTIGELFTEAYNEAPSFLPDEATAERVLPEMTPMSRTYAQDASVYNLPEEFGRIAAPLPLLDYARPAQIARMGKTPRILEEGLLTDEAVSALGRIPAGMSIEDVSYRGAHQAPMREEGVRSSLDDMSDIYPEDVYDPRVSPRYYGHTGAGDPNDQRSADLVAAYQGKPEAEVTIYRAVPKGQGITDINKGDWVTLNPNYAASHGNAALGGNYEIISKKVKAKEIISDGNSINEFGYDPVDVTPRILSAANPETGRTGFTSGGGTQIPALEPLREPTRMGGMNTLGNEDVLRQARFNMQKLDRTPQQILDEVLNDPNAVHVVGEAERDARGMLGYGEYERLNDKEMQGVINMRNNLLVDRTRQFDRETLITPMSERQSIIPPREESQRVMPRILEDTPKVEKEPPLLREPIQKTGYYPDTGTYSRLHQALLDLQNDPKVPASMTPRDLSRRLDAMGVTKADLEENGLNLSDYTRLNANGNQVVDIQRIFDEAAPPQERMGRVILDETGGGDADEMDLQGRRNQGQLAFADFYDAEAQHRMEDWLYDYMGDIENDYNSLGRELSPNTFDRQSSQTDQILEAIVDRLKMTSQAQTDEEAVIMAYDKLNEAIDQGGDWLDDLDSELGGGIREKAEETIYSREQEFYNENPYIDDTIEFAGEDFAIFGNDDIGYSVHHNGTNIINDVYDLNELEVQIQNWAMDRGYFGHGTGDGAMQWSQYLQGDERYYEPIEEVILTYSPKTGDAYVSSHYGSDIADGYVSHMRTSARETESGASVYHVDEIQSDLHQEGRKGGYRQEGAEDIAEAARLEKVESGRKLIKYENEFINGSEDLWRSQNRKMYEAINDPESGQVLDAIIRTTLDENTVYYDKAIAENIAKGRRDGATDSQKKAGKRAEEVLKDADPKYRKLIEMRIEDLDNSYAVSQARSKLGAPSQEYPLKDERWIKAMVRQAMERAVAKGNFDGITFSNPQNQINQWSKRYEKLYNEVYENKLKSILETIGKEYGVKPRKVKLNDPEMQEAGENWYLPLSRDMIESIRGRGVPLASAVGVTPAILDRINKEREDKTPRILRTA